MGALKGHCHCWDDCLGPCCWCGSDDDDARCPSGRSGPCPATVQARKAMG